MTIGFGEKGIQKARDAHGGVSPWVSPGPSIAIPSHGNWELSIPQSLSAPLVSTQHSPPLKGCSCWGPFHSPSQDSASPNTVLPGRSLSPLLLVQTQISLLFPLSTPHRTTWNTKRTKPKETGSTYSQEIPLVPRKWCLPMSLGQERRTPWSGHVCFGQPITLPMPSKNTRFFL